MVALLASIGLVGAGVATVFGGARPPAEAAATRDLAPQMEPAGPPVAAVDAIPTPPATTERMSVGDREGQGNALSGGQSDILEAANGDQAISADGRWVAFVSNASNLIPGETQAPGRIYLRDRESGSTFAIPWLGGARWPNGYVAAEPAISAHGEVVAFTVIVPANIGIVGTVAPQTLPYVVVWDRQLGLELVSRDDNGDASPGFQPTISADGRYVAYTRWAPEATPEPTPADTTAPTMSNLTAAFGCVSQNGSITITVDAFDPDDGVSGVILSYTPVNGFTYQYGMFLNSGTGHWEGVIAPPSTWTSSNDGFISYSVRGYDFHGNYSQPLFPSTDNRVFYTYQGCIL